MLRGILPWAFNKPETEKGEQDVDDHVGMLKAELLVCALSSHDYWIATEAPLEHNQVRCECHREGEAPPE